jgi:hypothetical protein
MLNMVMGWKSGCGKIWSWHAFLMVCCHTELSMQMAEASCVWYCVTFVVGGGSDAMMACWKEWRLSASFSSPHVLCRSCLLVISVPVELYPDQWSGSCCMSALMWWSVVDSASMRCSMVRVVVWVVGAVEGEVFAISGLCITGEGLWVCCWEG